MTDDAWATLLDALEAELEHGRDAHEDGAVWHPPAAPLPQAHADRARALLHRQQERIAELRARQDTVAQQLATLRLVPDATAGASAYLDVIG